MEYTYFKIGHFRGIQDLTLDLTTTPKSRIFPLVGLNESGKTTILEAINYFAYKTETLDPINLPGYSIKDIHSLIPISQRSNFNGEVKFEYGLQLDEQDIKQIQDFLVKSRKFKGVEIGDTIGISHTVKFKNSKHSPSESKVMWIWTHRGKQKGARSFSTITGEDWTELTKFTKGLIPSVLYFPTFLFEFPEKIYLEDNKGLDEKHKFYRTVLQDILDATNTGTTITTHIVERARSTDTGDKKNLNNLLLEMGRHVTNTVFPAWNRIFKSTITQRNVRFTYDLDPSAGIYIQLHLEDTDGQYLLSERSLGFRWFFVFLLLTHYRGFRKGASKNVLFLFDEPASNLHASAQSQLLNSFGLISKSCMIMYTTHSHHMIDPKYLDGTFVIRNEGMDYEDPEDKFNAQKTDISATKYRIFVTKHPDQTHYYKPVLDVLDYQPSQLEHVPNVIMVEGKSDFYLLKYFSEVIFNRNSRLNFLPGTGAGTLDRPIQLYLAWGRQFIVLLDDDPEGHKQRTRYTELFGALCDSRMFTLREANPTWGGYCIERLITDDDKLRIQQAAYPDTTKYNKTHFQRATQELLMLDTKIPLSENSTANINMLLDFFQQKLSSDLEAR